MGRRASQKCAFFARPHTLPAKSFPCAHQCRADSCSSVGSRRASPGPAGRPGRSQWFHPAQARFADRRRARDTILPLPPATARKARCGAAKAITASCCQRYPYWCSSARRADARKRTLPNRGSKASGNSHSSLSRCHSVWPASHRPTAWRRRYRGGLPVLQRRKREFTDL